MEIRVLEYFLAVAREQNISRAAEYLHITQPTLSRQLKELEDEMGKQLLVRGKRKVTLTDEGALLRKRAEEIVSLAKRTEAEVKNDADNIAGDVYIGAGESIAMKHIIAAADSVQRVWPDVHFNFTSGDSDDLAERLDKGLFDFCVLYGDIDQSKYEYIKLPYEETWGLLMRKDSELAAKDRIMTEDLWNEKLILSRRSLSSPSFMKWMGKPQSELNITNTYNLIYNGRLMAEAGMGYVLTLKDLVNTSGTDLCFKSVYPKHTLPISLVWKKYQTQTKAAEEFLDEISNFIER